MAREHTARYLSHIFGSGTGSRRTSGSTTEHSAGATPVTSKIAASDTSSSGHEDDEALSIASKSSLSPDEMQQRILEALDDQSTPEEDKPDILKDQLSLYLNSENSQTDLDAIVLGLLHRHREDLNPTGATFSPPTTPVKKSMSRSSSFRRNLAAPGLTRRASGLSLNGGNAPSRPHSPSPLSVSGMRLSTEHVPSSQRHLSVAASEFRPGVGGTTVTSAVHTPTGLISSPGPANWSFNGSPLGTPRFQNSMASSQNSYFPSVPSPSLATASTKDIWSDQTSTQLGVPQSGSPSDEPPDVFQHVSDWQRQQAEAAAHLSTGMTGTGAYTMTPLDVLCSVFADSSVSSAEMEAALDLYAWDIDKAIEHITLHHHGEQSYQDPPPGITGPDPDELAKGINNIILPGAAPRQPNFGRAGMLARSDSFQHSPRNSAPSSPRWGSRPITPVAASAGASGNGQNLSPYAPSAASNRVCRYYLQGSCLRSDCRYNHDISKAVCRFWLRGHCLKGPDRCDFMHLIPPHLAQDVAAMKMRMDQERRERRERERELEGHDGSVEEEFPSLGVSSTKGKRDPAATRWASAVKAGKPVPTAAMQTFINENPLPGAGEASAHLRSSLRGASIGERQSPRVTLKPPVLLPTLATGSKMSESYAQYRERFLELGAARASCLSKAAESWKRGDGAGAKMWSREAQNHDVERLTAGREASQLIMEERKRLLKEAVTTELNRDGRVDPIADRSAKGKEAGAGLGIVLGITSREGSSQMTPEERCEVAIDLHGLHAEEATDILFRFLSGLESEAFLGIAYCVIGQEKHSVQGQVKTSLRGAVTDLLDQYRYPYLSFGGILAIDPRQHI